MFLEADFVCVVWVGFVAVDGFGAVRVLERGFLLVGLVVARGGCVVGHAAELGGGRVAAVGTGGTARVA